MKILFAIWIICLLLVGITSCDSEKADIPAYIRINSSNFVVDSSGTQGSSSSKINDIWLSVNGQQIGANNIPSEFPVIIDPNIGMQQVRLSAGIIDNGISNTRKAYPFYAVKEYLLPMIEGETYTFDPIFTYDSSATIINIEDFEQPGTAFGDDLDGNPNTSLIKQTVDVFEGTASGQLYLDSANLECTVASSVKQSNLQPPGTSFPVYIEMDYKTNTLIQVGIQSTYSSGSVVTDYFAGINPNETWNKIYFNITELIFTKGANQYQIVFRALNQNSNITPLIYLDNIKLLHF